MSRLLPTHEQPGNCLEKQQRQLKNNVSMTGCEGGGGKKKGGEAFGEIGWELYYIHKGGSKELANQNKDI